MTQNRKILILKYLTQTLKDVVRYKKCGVVGLPEDVYDFTFNRYIVDEDDIQDIPIDEVIQDLESIVNKLQVDEQYYGVIEDNIPNWVFYN